MGDRLQGHKLIKMYGKWVFDITEYKIYELSLNRRGKVVGMQYVGRVITDDKSKYTDITSRIPVCVMDAVYTCIDEMTTRRQKLLYGV